MDTQFLHTGFGLTEVALAVQRMAVGTFFCISGYHKLFNRARHERLIQTLKEDKVPFIRFHEWWVPGWEFLAGFALAVGFASVFSAGVLFVICAVACFCEARAKVASYQPLDLADALDDYLYLPEVLYLIMLLVVMLGGGGALRLDEFLHA